MGERILSMDELESMLVGVGILGTGGGGDPELFGRPLVEWDLKKGREYRVIDPESVDDESFVVCGGYAGSVTAYAEIGDTLQRWEKHFELLEALKVTEGLFGKSVDHVVPFELGGANTPVMLSLAARAGITAIDGDGLGRAAPETQMSSFFGHGISITPMPFVDRDGNILIVKRAVSSVYPDEVMRLALELDGGMGANNHYPMTGRELKEAVIPKTISLSIEVGDAVRNAAKAGRDPAEAVIDVSKGFELFRGVVKTVSGRELRAHYYAEAVLEGRGPYSGRSLEITFKNEAMMARIDGEVLTVFPDLICMLNPRTGKGIMTTDIKPGVEMVVVGIPAHRRLRECLEREAAREAFSPARFGLPNVKYEPIEVLVKRNLG
ncbi:MAG: Protein of unknown function DUF917 [Candidatus Bathyarchaeota archaeon B26-2]|nr:MAG: Protein of unknown function DUF917 [Candidatus Bathyarchaeota archaeon B26-2]